MAEIDYFGTVSGYRVPDKVERTSLKSVKSEFINAPIFEKCPLVIECELVEIATGTNFSTVLARIVNMKADEKILGENGKIDSEKIGMLLYDSFSNSYMKLGKKVGKAWSEGKKFI